MPSLPVNPKKQKGAPVQLVKTDLDLAIESISLQQRVFQDEFQDLCKSDEQKQFCKQWIEQRFIPCQATARMLWEKLWTQQNSLSKQDMSRVRVLNLFVEWMELVWTKYLQVGLYEMAAKLKQPAIRLAQSEFDELPSTTLKNIENMNLFDDFLKADLQIEVCRYFKLKAIKELAETEDDLFFLAKYGLNEVVNQDEALIYDKLIQKLQIGEKWGQEHTDKYITLGFKFWKDDMAEAEQDLQEFQAQRKINLLSKSKENLPQEKIEPSPQEVEMMASAVKVSGKRGQVALEHLQHNSNIVEDSSDSDYEGGDDDSDQEAFVPRRKQLYFKDVYQNKERNPIKFGKGFDPKDKDIFKFILGDNVACPSYLPMFNDDTTITAIAIKAASHDPEIPMSELVRREFFYNCFSNFTKALNAEPALFAEQIRAHCLRYSTLFSLPPTKLEAIKFTKGDYRRFCALIYLFTRKVLMHCDTVMKAEKKKRVMPRHIMTSMVSLGIIPMNIVRSMPLSEKDKLIFEQIANARKRKFL